MSLWVPGQAYSEMVGGRCLSGMQWAKRLLETAAWWGVMIGWCICSEQPQYHLVGSWWPCSEVRVLDLSVVELKCMHTGWGQVHLWPVVWHASTTVGLASIVGTWGAYARQG